mmetsp:Transcript_24013/g.40269  ORF Transcript_24013/g.40269 Transcript_24013/m.40269 type:complete len:249 (+) Transcript_24013:493-1239(+)
MDTPHRSRNVHRSPSRAHSRTWASACSRALASSLATSSFALCSRLSSASRFCWRIKLSVSVLLRRRHVTHAERCTSFVSWRQRWSSDLLGRPSRDSGSSCSTIATITSSSSSISFTSLVSSSSHAAASLEWIASSFVICSFRRRASSSASHAFSWSARAASIDKRALSEVKVALEANDECRLCSCDAPLLVAIAREATACACCSWYTATWYCWPAAMPVASIKCTSAEHCCWHRLHFSHSAYAHCHPC